MRVYFNTQGGSHKAFSEDRILVQQEVFANEAGFCDIDQGNVALADGVGGNRGGAVAAFQVCKMLSEIAVPTDEDFKRINLHLLAQGRADERRRDMATTLTGICFLSPDNAFAYHVGNTRLYAIQAGMYLRQLTVDDTVVEYLLQTGKLTPEEAIDYPKRNEITACFGGNKPELLRTKIMPVDLGKYSLFLVTCDGIHEVLSDDEMEDIISEDHGDWSLVSERLVNEAVKHGSVDDCSVIIIDCSKEGNHGSPI